MSTLATDIFDSDFAFSVLNLRHRIPIPAPSASSDQETDEFITDNYCLNFVGPTILSRADLASPKFVNYAMKKATHSSSVTSSATNLSDPSDPTLYQRLRLYGVFFVSNWSNLPAIAQSHPFVLRNRDRTSPIPCSITQHIPVMLHSTPMHTGLVFDYHLLGSHVQQGKGKTIGIVLTCRPEHIEKLKAHPMILEKLL